MANDDESVRVLRPTQSQALLWQQLGRTRRVPIAEIDLQRRCLARGNRYAYLIARMGLERMSRAVLRDRMSTFNKALGAARRGNRED